MSQSSKLSEYLAASTFVRKGDNSLTDVSNDGSLKQRWDSSKLSASIANKYSIIQDLNNIQNSSILQNSRSFSRSSYNRDLQRQEVKSIIFNSKVQKIDSKKFTQTLMATYLSESKLNTFKEKVVNLNVNIDAGISNIQKMIESFRKKKDQSILHHQQQQAIISNKASESRYVCSQISEESQNPIDSKVQLKGPSHTQFAFPSQYATFITRLSHQIQMDMHFTNNVAELTNKGLIPHIKSIICNHLSSSKDSLLQSFLTMEPSQIDPLQSKSEAMTKHTEQWLREKAQQLYEQYEYVKAHFQNKLKHKFSSSIIKLLFQQLSKSSQNNANKESITIGQIISYVNIKTNSSFRNRFFVKIMKRMNLKGNGNLTVNSLQLFVQQSV